MGEFLNPSAAVVGCNSLPRVSTWRVVTMASVTVAVIGSLAGVALGSGLGFLAQYLLASMTRKWQQEDTKRQSYAAFLTSISASYAKAKAGKGDPEESDLLRATSVIELIADEGISEQARSLQIRVTDVHGRLRQGNPAAERELPGVDHDRRELIKLFKADLDIPLDTDKRHKVDRAGVS